MSQPKYTVFVRVPIPRGDFVDPPPVHWDLSKDEALWKILSGAAQKEVDFGVTLTRSYAGTQVAERFDVPVDFLLKQVAYLTERHASQVRAQVRKATAAAKGSAAPSPIPGAEPTGSSHPRAPSALSGRRDSVMPRYDCTPSGTPVSLPSRPNMSRDTSAHTTILKDVATSSSPRHVSSFPGRAIDPAGRKRLSSLPIQSPTPKSPEPQTDQRRDETASPGPAESSSNESSDDESSPAQSRIIRRPPRFQPQEAAETYRDDGDDESEPAFQPLQALDQPGQDLASTLRGDGRVSGRRNHKNSMREYIRQSQTSDDSSTGSPTAVPRSKSKESKIPGPLSPRRTTELAGRSLSGQAKAGSHEGSDGTPSMGSSFSDLDDASVTQSALEEALASHMGRGASSRYFVDDSDEIRSIEDPKQYFKFFLNKNARINQRQRFAFDNALEDIIHQRLTAEGLEKIALPPGRTTSQSHIPVFATPDLALKTRILLFFGEPNKALGMLAGRVANGPGGINKGSLVSVVQELKKQASSDKNVSPPGIFIANTGQLYWWPDGGRNLTATDSTAIPLPSLVHTGRRYVPGINSVAGHETPESHVASVFNTLRGLMGEGAKVSLVAVGQSCELVTDFLESKSNWHAWEGRLDAMLLLGTVYPADSLTNRGLRDFLAKRTRAYIVSTQPLDTPLAPPSGNEDEQIPAFGCPCYSSSEPFYIEMVLIRALKPALGYLESVALTPGYENDDIVVAGKPKQESADDNWEKLADWERPTVGFGNAEFIR
ncbi:uncharacterized protein MAM_00380 [Metarhizium album ARSEF 1941]|uniref:Autophagy-related protein 29 n=1 Tax=Metarhizium album (strain ARSEF 1941) TaxID=1081103 RepID=A0A0B2X4T8_METAS|nr:uncharacterized protein MAM_00380 [Metarhizium album ARSEF 1941]KHO01379.1 hypothetical protein MAM_00380 [Metarhizium album ARSEF 1941]